MSYKALCCVCGTNSITSEIKILTAVCPECEKKGTKKTVLENPLRDKIYNLIETTCPPWEKLSCICSLDNRFNCWLSFLSKK